MLFSIPRRLEPTLAREMAGLDQVEFYRPLTDGAGPRLAPTTLILDSFAAIDNWQATAACEATMVPVGICTTPQIGTLVSVTKVQFLDWRLRLFFLGKIAQYHDHLRALAKAAEAAAEPVPDIGN